ncbi:hypothetical protein V2I01_41740 [Micromonospora sp. BRA006-A]|nr:hypothetical protein [Micromonospora sp. BRA006-A]
MTSAWSFGVMPLRAAMGPPQPDWDVDRQVVAAQPFFRYVVHDAVAALGGAEHVARLCRDWRALLTEETDTWPETWSGGSLCHGWSATPSRDLPLYTLGAGPAAPGFARARSRRAWVTWTGRAGRCRRRTARSLSTWARR